MSKCVCGKSPLYCSYHCAKYAEGLEDIKQIMYSLSEQDRLRVADMIMELDYFSMKEVARGIVEKYGEKGS